jgi:hypothetical protein
MSLDLFRKSKKQSKADLQEKALRMKEESFQTTQSGFPMPEPEDYLSFKLEPLTKRKITICNLFANHQKSVPEIVELLDSSRNLVIDTLVEYNLLKDRRKARRPHSPSPEELG